MYRRKDNDIFGLRQDYAPKIQNDSYVDPNAHFKRRTELNYQELLTKLDHLPKKKSQQVKAFTKVNEQVKFQQNYHKQRKEIDLQSSIFYPPSPKASINHELGSSLLSKIKSSHDINFGRKETLNRQVKQEVEIKGNQSHLFGLTNRGKQLKKVQQTIAPLIPYKMQWVDHDSIRHHQINHQNKGKHTIDIISHQIRPIDTKTQLSIVSPKKPRLNIFQQNLQLNKDQRKDLLTNKLKKAKSEGSIVDSSKKEQEKAKSQQFVQIQIVRGWNYKYMEGLSKVCKFNQGQIVRFQAKSQGKALLQIRRTKKWQNITDWLRLQAHLKLRVLKK